MTRYAQYPRVCGRLCTRFPRPCFFSSAGASDADKRQEQPIGAHKAVRRLPFPNGCAGLQSAGKAASLPAGDGFSPLTSPSTSSRTAGGNPP